MSAPRLTARRLNAIVEALCSRLAGERDIDGDPDAPRDEDYEAALAWAQEQLSRKAKP